MPCKHGHISVRGVRKWNCLVCDRLQKVAERQRDPERVRANEKRTRTKNKTAVVKRIKDWQQRNPEKIALYGETQRLKAQNEFEYAERRRYLWRNWSKKQREEGTAYAVAQNLRCRLNNSLRSRNLSQSQSVLALIGCSIDELKSHLESQFLEGMTWTNWTTDGWHIDHIRPCASFEDPADPRCWHYTNLQPLWAKDNLRKSDHWDEPMAHEHY